MPLAWLQRTLHDDLPAPRVKRIRCGVELCVSLQIAILKVLVSHPAGRTTIAALNSDLSILNTSGSDWNKPVEAVSRPGSPSRLLVLRDSSDWQITPEGRAFLD